jgi:hypothetical protein
MLKHYILDHNAVAYLEEHISVMHVDAIDAVVNVQI